MHCYQLRRGRQELDSMWMALQTCAITMNMMAGPPCFKRAIVLVGEARTSLHPNLSQDLDRSADPRCCVAICILCAVHIVHACLQERCSQKCCVMHLLHCLKVVASFNLVVLHLSQPDGRFWSCNMISFVAVTSKRTNSDSCCVRYLTAQPALCSLDDDLMMTICLCRQASY